ncbi:MAG TPA: radical SAM protein [bacterium]|nr:radical SAM protein [bacterium]
MVWVDRDYMRSLGYADSELWTRETDLLSAPTEVHLQPTNRCGAGCRACYTDADGPTIKPEDELSPTKLREIVDALADMRVFHLALGGGESLGLEGFFELAEYARARGLLPSLTTNGFDLTPAIAKRCRIFSAVHVSIDGVGELYKAVRGYDRFAEADHAVQLLRQAGCQVGLNTVVCRQSADGLDDLVAYAARRQVKQIELLRFKPAGRAREHYDEMKPTHEQLDSLYPRLVKLMKKHKVRLLADCSLAPMIYLHRPDPQKLDLLGVTGCLGGNMLMSVTPDGVPAPCSFARGDKRDASTVGQWWSDDDVFRVFRRWNEQAPEPCRSCDYLKLCHGGCHVVAEHVTGDACAPDPDCGFVRDYQEKKK